MLPLPNGDRLQAWDRILDPENGVRLTILGFWWLPPSPDDWPDDWLRPDNPRLNRWYGLAASVHLQDSDEAGWQDVIPALVIGLMVHRGEWTRITALS